MWPKINNWASRLFGGRPSRICFDEAPRFDQKREGVVVEIPCGDAGRCPGVDARLTGTLHPERVHRIVRFAGRRRLPVDVWLIRHVWAVPARADAIARWLIRLEADSGRALISLDAREMPTGFRRRLVGNLRRFDCRIGPAAA